MCGLAGLLHFRPESPADGDLLRRMTRAIAHRGPDGDGHWLDGPVGLGHRRLAIIDVTGGVQPMGNEDGTLQVVFNGELYNYAEFVPGLRERGHVFRTKSDTEVLLHLFEEEGLRAFERLRGMFAVALWDTRRRRLLLVRDRLGVKPLYYAEVGGRLLFGSEIKTLLADPALPREIDPAALQGYLATGFVPGPHALLAAVRQVPPGYYLEVEVGGTPRVARWWNFERHSAAGPVGEAEALEALDAHVRETVRLRMVSDVPVGAFLSGGIDSSLVVALMAQQSAEPVKTFSIGFDFAEFDERPYARMVAERYGTDHEELVVSADVQALLPTLIWHYDDPLADVSAIPMLRVAEIAARRVTVALSGDGGDEAFGGYTRYANALKDAYADRLPAAARALLGGVAEMLPDTARGKNRLRWLSHAGDARYASFFQATPPHLVRRHLAPAWRAATPGRGVDAEMAAAFAACPYEDPLARMQYFDAALYLPGDILPKVDRASMAYQLEAREPLLDHRVMEFGLNLPPELRISGADTKRLLRQLARRHVPAAAIDRPKHGFSVPMDRWMNGELRPLLEGTLLDDTTRRRGWLEPTGIRRTIDEHRTGRARHGHTLWSLLVLELWARRFLDGPLNPPPPPPPRAEFLERQRGSVAGGRVAGGTVAGHTGARG